MPFLISHFLAYAFTLIALTIDLPRVHLFSLNHFSRVTPIQSRFWEVDILRGIGILLVIYYHLVFDLQHFALVEIEWRSDIWKYQAKFIKSIFLFLVGASVLLSINHARSRAGATSTLFWRYAKRGAGIFAIGMLITLATTLALPEGAVHFGILHAIGVSIPLAYLMLPLGRWLWLFGTAIVALGFVVAPYSTDGPWWIWLGILPKGYWTVDYAPLIPNFGIVLLGVATASWMYPNNQRRFVIRNQITNRLALLVCRMGRHSLLLYLVHQPFLFGVFYALDFVGLIRL